MAIAVSELDIRVREARDAIKAGKVVCLAVGGSRNTVNGIGSRSGDRYADTLAGKIAITPACQFHIFDDVRAAQAFLLDRPAAV